MTRKSKFICLAVVLAIVAAFGIPSLLRYNSNVKLGKELQAEVDAWLASLPRVPESENGALLVNRAIEQFDDFYDVFGSCYPRLDSETMATTLRQYLIDKKAALELLEEGLVFEKWAYTTDYEKG